MASGDTPASKAASSSVSIAGLPQRGQRGRNPSPPAACKTTVSCVSIVVTVRFLFFIPDQRHFFANLQADRSFPAW